MGILWSGQFSVTFLLTTINKKNQSQLTDTRKLIGLQGCNHQSP